MCIIPTDAKKPIDWRSLKHKKYQTISLKPFVKWSGGKGQLLTYIRKTYPVVLGVDIKKYAEPFVGGGAVLFDILSSYNLDAMYISDINAELINAYRMIRMKDELIGLLSEYQNEFIPLEDAQRKNIIMPSKRFNELKINGVSSINLKVQLLLYFLTELA